MFKPDHIKSPLVPDSFYYIYNRGNSKDNIFFNELNYAYFLNNYDKFLSNYIDTYCYCLIPNHFHFLIKIKNSIAILNLSLINKSDENKIPNIISEQFRKLFISYSKAINKQQNRNGSLFQKYFKRKPILKHEHFLELIPYIHLNPMHHNITDDYENYKWSSYRTILSPKPTKLKRNELLEIVEGIDNFIQIHKTKRDFLQFKELFLEEE